MCSLTSPSHCALWKPENPEATPCPNLQSASSTPQKPKPPNTSSGTTTSPASGFGCCQAGANPDEIADLVARLLAQAVEERQRRQLSLGYRPRSADLSRVRGRIDVLRTERRQLIARGAVACRFVELSVDTPRNRFVRGALKAVARLVSNPDQRLQ